jgi:Homeodomain-like domain/Transposase, Mutator family
MERTITKPAVADPENGASAQLFEDWFDPIESAVRAQVRHFIEGLIEAELEEVLARPRYRHRAKADDVPGDGPAAVSGHRHGRRSRSLTGTFGPVQITVPRARLNTPDGKTTEWKSDVLPAYQRRTKAADALIAGAYLSGTNTRAWYRRLVARKFDGSHSRRGPGRPRIDQDVEGLIVRMARENRSWGYDRIVGALANLGYHVSDQTVGNVLRRHGIPPAPERRRTTTWAEFIRTHLALLAATDFFAVEVLTLRGLVTYYLLFFIHLERAAVWTLPASPLI